MGTIQIKALGIVGIEDRERLKLYRDELFEYIKRGFADDEDSVDELSIFDRNRIAAEMVRINEYLSATSNKKANDPD